MMNHNRIRARISRTALLRATSATLVLVLASAPLALAQDEPTTQPQNAAPTTAPADHRNGNANATPHITTQPGGGLMLNFKDASIDSVLDELSAAGGFIVVKETKPEGKVTLVSKQAVTASDAVSLLNTVLKNAGYAAIQQGRILKVVQRDRAKRANIPVRSGADPEKIEPTDELITQVIPLRYADAMQLKTDLTPLISSEADFTANASSNALVITDTSANIRRVVEIVSALDTHLADSADVKVFQLQYASAASAAKLITDLFGSRTTGNRNQNQTGGGFPGFGGFGGFGQGGGAFGGFGGFGRGNGGGNGGGGNTGGGTGRGNTASTRQEVPVNASSDDRTNTIVVTGPPDTLKVVERVIKEIDSNPASEETVTIYHLKNATAANVESVVNNLFNGTTGSSRSQSTLGSNRLGNSFNSNSSSGRAFGGSGSSGGRSGSSPFGGSSGGSSFGGSNSNNRSSTFGQFGNSGGTSNVSSSAAQTASALAGQVSVIADTDTNSLLVRTNPKNYPQVKNVLDELDRSISQVLIKVLIAEVTHDSSSDIGAEFSVLNLRANGNGQKGGTNFSIPVNPPGNTGLVVSVLETDFSAALRALETAGKLDVLSRPYILASDNQLASITVGQEVPFVTNTRTTDTGQTINTIEYGDIGILLDVVPHINPDKLVILDVAPEISALTGTTVPISETVSAPVFAKRSAQSRVAVKNGQTIVIGGLMEDRKTETINKVPLLGDIPLLGELFKRRQITKTKTELLIFLTPQVAAEPGALKGMGEDELNGAKLVPNAVGPGEFEEHMRGMQRGGATTQPAEPLPDPSLK